MKNVLIKFYKYIIYCIIILNPLLIGSTLILTSSILKVSDPSSSHIIQILHEPGILILSQQIFVILFVVVFLISVGIIYILKLNIKIAVIMSIFLTFIIRIFIEPTSNLDSNVIILNHIVMTICGLFTVMLLYKRWNHTGNNIKDDDYNNDSSYNDEITEDYDSRSSHSHDIDMTNKKRGEHPESTNYTPQNSKIEDVNNVANDVVNNVSPDRKIEDANDALNELLKNITSQSQKAQDKTPHQDTFKQQSTSRKHIRSDKLFQEDIISTSDDTNNIFELSPTTTCDQIKSKYKELAKKHNPSIGRINKSKEENERADAIMANINKVYADLKKKHGCK